MASQYLNIPKTLPESQRRDLLKLEPLLTSLGLVVRHKRGTETSLLIPSPSDPVKYSRVLIDLFKKHAFFSMLHEIGHYIIHTRFKVEGRESYHTQSLGRSKFYCIEEELEAWTLAIRLYREQFKSKVQIDWQSTVKYIVECLETYVEPSKNRPDNSEP